jgi:hypothetical protein
LRIRLGPTPEPPSTESCFETEVEVLACGESRSPAAGSRRPDGRQPW